MDIFQWYELSRSRSGVAYLSYFDTLLINKIGYSTRNGRIQIDWGDGTIETVNPPKYYDYSLQLTSGGTSIGSHTYASSFTGIVSLKFLLGFADVYSLNVAPRADLYDNRNKIRIDDFGTFIKQFPNLFSFYLDTYNGSITTRNPIIKGNLFEFPDSVQRVWIGNTEINTESGTLVANLDGVSYSSDLRYFHRGAYTGGNVIKLIGDLRNIPINCNYFKFEVASAGSAITYTAGKVWASSFDTLYLPIPLTIAETDNIFIDAYNSVTTAIGGKSFTLQGFRSSSSDVAVAGLIAMGFTVNCERQGIILDLPLQNNFTDYSISGISMVAGNVNGLPSFVSDGSGGYAVDFGGTKSIKTSVNLPLNTSDKVSIEFDIKTTATAAQVVMELSPNYATNNSFGVFINDTLANRIEIADRNSGSNIGNSAVNINDGNYHSVKMVIDRSLSTAQNKIYIDGVLSYVQNISFTADNNGNFGSFTLFIGQRNGSSVGFVGQLTRLKIYNYPIL